MRAPLCTAPHRSFMMEYDIHTVLDALTLLATSAVIFCMFKSDMRVTYQKDQDAVKFYFVVSRGAGFGCVDVWVGVWMCGWDGVRGEKIQGQWCGRERTMESVGHECLGRWNGPGSQGWGDLRPTMEAGCRICAQGQWEGVMSRWT